MRETSLTQSVSAEAARRDAVPPSFRQAALIGHLGAFAFLERDLDSVVLEACRVAVEGMGAGFAGVLRYWANEGAFVLLAGVGWPARVAGRTRVAADPTTTAGLAWLTGQLVHLRQPNAGGGVQVAGALPRHGVRRVVSVPIRADGRRAFGVLDVGSDEAGGFTPHDLAFVRGIADSVAAAADLYASRTEQVGPAVGRRSAPAGKPDAVAGRQGPARANHRRDARGGAG